MNCGICYKPMRKDVKIDDVLTCHTCRMIWVNAYKKIYNSAVDNLY